jgi:hypothetical protein
MSYQAVVEFLLARIDEDEAWAKGREHAAIRKHQIGRRGPVPPDHFKRVRAECETKRRIIEAVSNSKSYTVRDVVLGELASVYADHPDYLAAVLHLAESPPEAT